MKHMSRNRRKQQAVALACEPLEARQLLSTINWTNRGTTTGANDDRFDDVFGGLQNQARAVIDAAIDCWERTIVDFNYGNGTNTYNITVSMNATAQGSGAGGVGANAGFNTTINNKPATGSMGIGWRSGIAAGTNSAAGWFLDPTPAESSEFQGAFQNAFVRLPTPGSALGGADLFTAVLHELGHAMGLGSNTQTRAVSFDTNAVDNQNAPASSPASTLWASNFNGAIWTEYDSGGATGGAANFGGPQHFAPLGTSAVVFGSTRVGAVALMNAFFTSRSIISDVEADFARFAFNYTIATPSQFGTTYGQLDNDGTLRINTTSLAGSNDVIDIRPSGGNLQLTINPSVRVGTIDPLGAITNNFPAGQVQRIQIDVGDGDDFVRVFSNGNVPVTVVGGAGADTIEGHGAVNAFDSFSYTPSTFTANGLNVTSHSGFEQVRMWTEGGDSEFLLTNTGSTTSAEILGASTSETMNIRTLDALTPMVVFAGSGNDIINVQTDAGSGLIKSPVTVNGGDGNDVCNVGPVAFAGTLVTQPIVFNGGLNDDALVLGSDNADSVQANMTFNGEGGTDDRIVYNDQAPSYNIDYDVRPTFVNRVGIGNRNVTYSQTDRIVINCGSGADSVIVRNAVTPIVEAFGNGGNDNFTRGDGIITASSVATFNGGPGVDQITFDDHLNAGNIIFDCRQNEIFYGGLITQVTTGFESVGILAGTGQNEITFNTTITQNYNVDAGPGADTIIFGFNGGTATIQGSVVVNGGDDSDVFQLNAVNTSGAGTISINGGNNLNSMTVNRPGTLVYDIGGGFLNLFSFGSSASITTGNIESAGIQGNSLAESFNIFSASSLFGLYQVFGNNGDDLFNVIQPDGSNFSFDNLQLNGGAGVDTFVYDATAVTGNGVYTFANNFLSIPRGIVSDDISIGVAIENVTFNGGSGNDSVRVDQYSAGSSLRLNLGGGDDTLRYGNNNLQANLTNAALFQVNGGPGSDTVHVDNLNNTLAWSYTSNAGTFVSADNDIAVSYSWTMTHSNLDRIIVHAGVAGDGLSLPSVPAGLRIDFFGNNGNDGVNWINDLTQIRGPVYFNGEVGNDTISNLVSSDTTGQVVHVTQDSIGAYPGDVYFGPGGAVFFSSVSSILLTNGSGPDSVFAAPNVSATVTLRGGGGSDTLTLAMADAGNYSIDPGAFGSFDVVSQNAATLNYSSFEVGPNIDDTTPLVVASDFNFNGGPAEGSPAQSVSATFTEDVSAFLSPAFLELFNATTGTFVPAENIAVTWDAGTLTATFTFPGYANGLLPDGAYQARVLGGLVDPAGNPSPDGPVYTFVWSGGTAGADTFRVALDPATQDYQIFLNDDVTPAILAGQGTAEIVLAGGDDNDSLVIDLSGGQPVPPAGISFDGGDGTDTLAVRGSNGADTVEFLAGSVLGNGAATTYSNVESFGYDGNGGVDSLAVEAGNVAFPGTQRFDSLGIAAGASVTLPSTGNNLIITSGLSVDTGASVDVGGGGILLDYTDATPVDSILALIIAGRNGGTWDGAGITSSTVAADAANEVVGYAEASQLFSSFPATFLGEAVDDTAIIVRRTLLGDADLDHDVDIDDFASLAANFNQASDYRRGDFDYSGATDIDDFAALAARFNQSIPASRPAAGVFSSVEVGRQRADAVSDRTAALAGLI